MRKFLKSSVPVLFGMGVSAVPVFAAGQSPFAAFMQSAEAEATGVWAVSGAAIGLVVGLIGCLFGSHHIKEWSVTAVVICVALLSVQALIAWL